MKVYKDLIAETYVERQERILTESRVDFIKSQNRTLSTDHDQNASITDPNEIVDHFATHADPTKKKLYTNWIVNQYARSGMSDDELSKRKLTRPQPLYQEDVDKVHGILSKFDEVKHKLSEKDINKYDSIPDVQKAIEPFVENVEHHKVSESDHPGRELKYEDDRIKLYHLKTEEASKELYGGGSDRGKTDWCTAYQNDRCMFSHYAGRGNLYTVHDKVAKKVYQYHPHDAQFMDAKDNEVSGDDLKKILPHLHKAWEQDGSFVS